MRDKFYIHTYVKMYKGGHPSRLSVEAGTGVTNPSNLLPGMPVHDPE